MQQLIHTRMITIGLTRFDSIENSYSEISNNGQLVKFIQGYTPPFKVLHKYSGAASVQLIDTAGRVIVSIPSTTTAVDGYNVVSASANQISDPVCGVYQYKLNIGSLVFYSEWFQWIETEDAIRYLRLDVPESSILINNTTEINPIAEGYAYFTVSEQANQRDTAALTLEVTEEGLSKNYGNELLKTTTNFDREIEIMGNESTLRYLAMLAQMIKNTSFTVRYVGEPIEARFPKAEVVLNARSGEQMVIKFSFREADYFSNLAG